MSSTDRLGSVGDCFCGQSICEANMDARSLQGFNVIRLSSIDRWASVGGGFFERSKPLPYEGEIRTVWFRYTIFKKLKPVGSEAVRRVSTSEKNNHDLEKQGASRTKKTHHIAFFWFFSFAKEKNTHPPRIPASPLTGAAQDRRRRRGSRGRRGGRPLFLPLPLPAPGRGRGYGRGWLGSPSPQGPPRRLRR